MVEHQNSALTQFQLGGGYKLSASTFRGKLRKSHSTARKKLTSGVIPKTERPHFTRSRMAVCIRRLVEQNKICTRTKKEVSWIFKNYGMHASSISKTLERRQETF
jgi:hypothetical protein